MFLRMFINEDVVDQITADMHADEIKIEKPTRDPRIEMVDTITTGVVLVLLALIITGVVVAYHYVEVHAK